MISHTGLAACMGPGFDWSTIENVYSSAPLRYALAFGRAEGSFFYIVPRAYAPGLDSTAPCRGWHVVLPSWPYLSKKTAGTKV